MNAEDCPKHRNFIDQPGPQGIYYPWICECPEVCPCGYQTECGIWCGSGHETGQCESWHECDNCDGIDPKTCMYNPHSPYRTR